MERDRHGLELSTTSAAAAEAYRSGVDLLLAAWPGADAAFASALREDPSFALAHAAAARLNQIYGRGEEARACIAKARAAAAAGTPRERAHIEILGLAVEGAAAKALEALLRHVEEWPRDALVLSLALGAFGLYAFSGRADHDAARVALCEQLAPHYGKDWWFATFHGWAHTEAGNLDKGYAHTALALDLRSANAHGAHALAHWYAESGDRAEGASFLGEWLRGYVRDGMLYSHLSWHCTLAFLETGQQARALRFNAERLRPSVTLAPPINKVSDCASLLWRISLTAPVAAEEWQDLARYIAERFPGPAPHFIELHIAMVLAATGEHAQLEKRLADIHAREASGAFATGGTLEAVCRGLAAFGRGDHREAAARLGPAAPDFVRLGGSGAQRRLLHDTLAAAQARL